MKSPRQVPLIARYEFQNNVLGQLAKELGFEEKENMDDRNTIGQESQDRDVFLQNKKWGRKKTLISHARANSSDTVHIQFMCLLA